MKRKWSSVLAVSLAAVLGMSVLAGCGQEAAAPEPEVEEIPEEEYEVDLEEPEDAGYEEEAEYEEEEIVEEEPAEAAEAAEPADDMAESDQVLMEGYYGFWKGDTEYIFGVLSEKDFMINVVGASAPVLYAEGEYKDNGDGTYTAKITSSDNDFAADQTINIKAEGGPDISLTSDNAEVNAAVEGMYTHAGEKASDVENLK